MKFFPKEPEWFRAVNTARSSITWTYFLQVNGNYRCNANNRERLHWNIFISATIKDERGFASAHYVNDEESNHKFKLFILNLWELVRLFAAMACVNLVFPRQKRNSNELNETLGDLIRFFLLLPSVSVVQFTVQMSKLNGLGKTHWERMKVHPLIQL